MKTKKLFRGFHYGDDVTYTVHAFNLNSADLLRKHIIGTDGRRYWYTGDRDWGE